MVSEIDLPDIIGQPFAGDDSGVSTSNFEPSAQTTTVSPLPDGGRLQQQIVGLRIGLVLVPFEPADGVLDEPSRRGFTPLNSDSL